MFFLLAMPLFTLSRDPECTARRMAAMFGPRAESIASVRAREALLADEREAWRFWLDVRIDLMARRLGVGSQSGENTRPRGRRRLSWGGTQALH